MLARSGAMSRRTIVALTALAVLAVTACTTDDPGPEPEPPSPTPTETSLGPPPDATVAITGPEEVVFDWSSDACESEHIPDLATRAFRDADGTTQLLLSHYVGYRMVGDGLDALAVDCDPVWSSARDGDPARYDDATWMASPYTDDGRTIRVLAHMEFQGHTHAGLCPSGDYFDCLDTRLVLWESTDGGDSYHPVADPPDHFVGGMPQPYSPQGGPFGLRTPSNIVVGPDGAYYAVANALRFGTQEQWICLLRTDDLADPAAWRWWDGAAFGGVFVDPAVDQDGEECAPLAIDQIGATLTDSLVYDTELEAYVLIGLSADQIDGREVWGFYASFSRDLLTWSHRTLIAEMPLPWTVADSGTSLSVLYPSLLDPDSADRNFGTTDGSAYLYYTRHNRGQGSLDRDLVRVPIEIALD